MIHPQLGTAKTWKLTHSSCVYIPTSSVSINLCLLVVVASTWYTWVIHAFRLESYDRNAGLGQVLLPTDYNMVLPDPATYINTDTTVCISHSLSKKQSYFLTYTDIGDILIAKLIQLTTLMNTGAVFILYIYAVVKLGLIFLQVPVMTEDDVEACLQLYGQTLQDKCKDMYRGKYLKAVRMVVRDSGTFIRGRVSAEMIKKCV